MTFSIILLVIIIVFVTLTLWCCLKAASDCDDETERFWSSTNIDTDEVA